MSATPIRSLNDLARLRDAPELTAEAAEQLHMELSGAMAESSWFTIGIMASSAETALTALRRLEHSQGWSELDVVETTEESGPVFLKANQKGNSVRIRIEHGLGQGILISGHGDDDSQPSTTWGPLPLNFF